MKKATAAVVSFCLLVSTGCATHSHNIAAQHVSSMKYDAVDCRRLQIEYDEVSNRLRTLSASQDSSADGDAALMGVGLILFWPALLALPATGGGKVQEGEIGNLKGEKTALETAMKHRCDFTPPPAAPPPAKEEKTTQGKQTEFLRN